MTEGQHIFEKSCLCWWFHHEFAVL